MNRAEFISQAVSFEPMKMVVVSGPDQTATLSMLTDAAAAIEIAHPDYVSYAIDSRAKSIYSYRWPGGQDVDQSVVWEFKAVVSEPNIVVLVANEFDINDAMQNPNPVNTVVDVVMDLFKASRVSDVPVAASRHYGICRELFPFIGKVYYYNYALDDVQFIKDQIPERP